MRVFSPTIVTALSIIPGLAGASEEKATQPLPEPVKLEWPARAAAPPLRREAAIACAGDLRGKTPPSEPPAAGADPLRLVRPFGLAVDAADRIFVADPSQHGVLVYDRKTGSAARWTGNARYPIGGPVAVALDRSGRLFVADGFRAQVVVFDPAGNPVAAFGSTVLKRPAGIAVDSQRGRVYIGDVRLHQVLSFDLRTFALDRTIGGPAGKGDPESARFFSPASLAVNSQGRLYVSDMRNCQVQVFSADGAFVQKFPAECSRHGAYGRPYAIAIDRADRIYVAAPDEASLQQFQPDGKPLRLLACPGARAGQPPVRTAIAVDRNNRVYLVEQQPGEGRVMIFAPVPDQRGQPAQTSAKRGDP